MANYYICKHCDGYMEAREASVFVPEIHYELDEKPTEWLHELRCIYCNAPEDELEEAEFCDYCGDIFQLEELEDGLCPACQKKLEKEKGENNDDEV